MNNPFIWILNKHGQWKKVNVNNMGTDGQIWKCSKYDNEDLVEDIIKVSAPKQKKLYKKRKCLDSMTKKELLEIARKKNISGRSGMNKEELLKILKSLMKN